MTRNRRILFFVSLFLAVFCTALTAHAAEEGPTADRDGFRLAGHPHVADVIVGGDALDQRRHPVVGQRGGDLDAAFRQLTVNARGYVHR